LAGADGTPASDDALDVAADLAASLGAPLFSCTPGLEPGPAPQAAYTVRQEDEARAYLFRFGQCPRTGGNCLGEVMPFPGKRVDTRIYLYAAGAAGQCLDQATLAS
jgi:nucleotide-binding universal stress UspA family protein